MLKKKESELNCFRLTQEYINRRASLQVKKYLHTLLPWCDNHLPVLQSERPDFIINAIGCSYAVEHFLIDFCNDGVNNNQSKSQIENRKVSDLFGKYHDSKIGTIKDSDLEPATADIEEELNRLANISSSFDYDRFIDSFFRVFDNHHKRIDEYRLNKEFESENIKIGFLIELHCDTCLMHASWNNTVVSFRGGHKAFPMTRDIIEKFKSAEKMDYIVLSQFNEGVFVEASDVRVFDPHNIDDSLEKQRIRVYDRVFYPNVNKHIKLNLTTSSTDDTHNE